MCGGTKVPGGKVACHENESSVQFLGTYVWPRMFQVMPCMPSLARVMPAISVFMVGPSLGHALRRVGWYSKTIDQTWRKRSFTVESFLSCSDVPVHTTRPFSITT